MNDPQTWQERQRRHLFFTWSTQSTTRGIEIVDAEGARFEAAGEGWKWDLESQVYNVNVGHRHPHLQRRMIEQITKLPACAPNAILPIRAELAGLLHEVTGLEKAFLTTGGSEAVENAIKIARLVTGRSKILARRHSYHGATLAVLSIAGDERRAPFDRDLAPGRFIDDPYPWESPDVPASPSSWLRSLDELLAREGPDTVAAILLEGLTGTNGMQEPPPDFWPGVRERCDRYGILLIDDEIFAGFGRTGRWFATQHFGIEPDLMVIGKGLTSGYAALAGVMVSKAIADHFEDARLWCGLTHYAHPVACAAAVGSVEVLRDERLVENADVMGARLRQRLETLRERHPDLVVGLRGRGLMQAMELSIPAGPVAADLWHRGAFVPSRERMLFLCPPLCVRADDVDAIADLFDHALAAAEVP